MRLLRFTVGMALALGIRGVVMAQVVDSPGGSVQMTPGGAVGKGDQPGIASHDAAEPGKPEYVPTSQEEQDARRLIELKEQRAEAASKVGSKDAQVQQLDAEIAAARQSMAQRTLANAAPEPGANEAAPVMPDYPRIVMPVFDEVAPAQTTGDSSSREPADSAAARQSLESSHVSFAAEAQPLGRVLQALELQTGVRLEINWKALAADGVAQDSPVSVNFREVPGHQALGSVLAAVGGSSAPVSYTILDGTVVVSTKDDLQSSKYQVVRVYDVRDLLGHNLYDYPTMYALQMYGSQAEMLMDTIKSTVARDTWLDVGGTFGSIRELNGQLIINQTADNHLAITKLLAQLRHR